MKLDISACVSTWPVKTLEKFRDVIEQELQRRVAPVNAVQHAKVAIPESCVKCKFDRVCRNDHCGGPRCVEFLELATIGPFGCHAARAE